MNDCSVETLFTPANEVEPPYHQLVGDGCIYPASVPTLGNQLTDKGLTWKAYLQDMGNTPSRDNTTQTSQGPACGHPPTGASDPTEGATAADQYATRHEGFMYFESVTGNQAYCDAHVLSFQPLLKRPVQGRRPRRTSPGSRPTCAWTGTTRRAPTATRAA